MPSMGDRTWTSQNCSLRTAPALDPGSGGGLDIVRVLAADWGVAINPAGRTVWARFDWPSR